jgi:energy-coupling factor transporter ATP-binding protein EcfA2
MISVLRGYQSNEHPRTVVETVPRKEFVREFGDDYVPGQHVTFLGPTGRGKSTLCFQLLGQVISPEHQVVSLHGKIKGRDPVIGKAAKRYHLRTVPMMPSRARQRYDRRQRRYNGYIVVPLEKPSDPNDEHTKLQAAFRTAIHQNYRTTGKNTITHINEAHQIQEELKLKRDVEAPLMRGGPDNAVWNEAQRGRYLSYHTYSAPEHIFVFYDDDSDNRKRYSDFGCADPEEIFWLTSHLKTRRSRDGRTISQCLYVRRSGGIYVVDT